MGPETPSVQEIRTEEPKSRCKGNRQELAKGELVLGTPADGPLLPQMTHSDLGNCAGNSPSLPSSSPPARFRHKAAGGRGVPGFTRQALGLACCLGR